MSKSWGEAKEDLDSITLFLVHRTGPTVYQIKDESENSFRVMLGNVHSCTCKQKGFCMHILFVLLKVLRIPASNPLSKKTGFTDAEIDVALSGDFEERPRPKYQPFTKKKTVFSLVKEGQTDESTVDRQPLNDEEENICPICQDEIKTTQALTWCRKGCGNNMHAKCMKMYAQYKVTNKKDIECPLCRHNWGPMAIHIINDDCKGNASLKKACANVTCQSCTFQVKGEFSRCLECSLYPSPAKSDKGGGGANSGSSVAITSDDKDEPKPVDFCNACFKNIGRLHAKHHFLKSSTNSLVRDFVWEYIRNPRTPQQLLATELLETLEQRELTTNDYDLLLGLDRPQQVSVQETILSAMRDCSGVRQCWCGQDISDDNAKSLVCGHVVHVECCRKMLDEAIQEGFWRLEELKCLHSDCGAALLGGLARRRRRRAEVVVVGGGVSGVGEVEGPPDPRQVSSGIMIAGAGISSLARGSVKPSQSESSNRDISTVVNSRAGCTNTRVAATDLADGSGSDSLIIQSGRRPLLPPRQQKSTVARQGTNTPAMRRGLALSRYGQGERGFQENTSKVNSLPRSLSVDNTSGYSYYGGAGSQRGAESSGSMLGRDTKRSTSASGVASSGCTSSFAPVTTKRRESLQSKMTDGVAVDQIFEVKSSSVTGARTKDFAPPVGNVPIIIKQKRTHIAEIRGADFLSSRNNIDISEEKSIALCLTVNNR